MIRNFVEASYFIRISLREWSERVRERDRSNHGRITAVSFAGREGGGRGRKLGEAIGTMIVKNDYLGSFNVFTKTGGFPYFLGGGMIRGRTVEMDGRSKFPIPN